MKSLSTRHRLSLASNNSTLFFAAPPPPICVGSSLCSAATKVFLRGCLKRYVAIISSLIAAVVVVAPVVAVAVDVTVVIAVGRIIVAVVVASGSKSKDAIFCPVVRPRGDYAAGRTTRKFLRNQVLKAGEFERSTITTVTVMAAMLP